MAKEGSSDVEFPCGLCDDVLFSRFSLEKHVSRCHRSDAGLEEGLHRCAVCGQVSSDAVIARLHQLCHIQSEQDQQEGQIDGLVVERVAAAAEEPLPPEVVQAVIPEPSKENTVFTVSTYPQPEEASRVDESREEIVIIQGEDDKEVKPTPPCLTSSSASSSSLSIPCIECDAVLHSRFALEKHMLRHRYTDQEVEECLTCGQFFADQTVLDLHQLTHLRQTNRKNKEEEKKEDIDNPSAEDSIQCDDPLKKKDMNLSIEKKAGCEKVAPDHPNDASEREKETSGAVQEAQLKPVESANPTLQRDVDVDEADLQDSHDDGWDDDNDVDHWDVGGEESEANEEEESDEGDVWIVASRRKIGRSNSKRKGKTNTKKEKADKKANEDEDVKDVYPLQGDDGKMIYQCRYCDKGYQNRSYALEHVRVVHLHQKLQCPHCPRTYMSDISLRLHLKSHEDGGKSVFCTICSRSFATERYLAIHKWNVHKESGSTKKHFCDLCNHEFVCKDQLNRHTLSAHRKMLNTGISNQDDLDESQGTTVEGLKRFFCNYCGLEFINRTRLEMHLIKGHKDRLEEGDGDMEELWNDAMEDTEENKKSGGEPEASGKAHEFGSPCEICGKFFHATYLQRHKEIVHFNQKTKRPTKPCPDCGKFLDAFYLKKHMFLVHKKIDPSLSAQAYKKLTAVKDIGKPCELCGKVFHPSYLKLHHKIVHLQQKSQKPKATCEECGKEYFTYYLNKHKRLAHGSEKPQLPKATCEECGKEYYTYYMNKHKRLAHGKGAKPRAQGSAGSEATPAPKPNQPT